MPVTNRGLYAPLNLPLDLPEAPPEVEAAIRSVRDLGARVAPAQDAVIEAEAVCRNAELGARTSPRARRAICWRRPGNPSTSQLRTRAEPKPRSASLSPCTTSSGATSPSRPRPTPTTASSPPPVRRSGQPGATTSVALLLAFLNSARAPRPVPAPLAVGARCGGPRRERASAPGCARSGSQAERQRLEEDLAVPQSRDGVHLGRSIQFRT